MNDLCTGYGCILYSFFYIPYTCGTIKTVEVLINIIQTFAIPKNHQRKLFEAINNLFVAKQKSNLQKGQRKCIAIVILFNQNIASPVSNLVLFVYYLLASISKIGSSFDIYEYNQNSSWFSLFDTICFCVFVACQQRCFF